MVKSIGSEFSLDIRIFFKPKINAIANDVATVSTGRCAIAALIQHLKLTKDDEVLLPAYLCPVILKAFQKENININYYKIKKNLNADLKDLEKSISKKTRFVYVIHYFGWPQPIDKIGKICRKKGALLVEDCAHSLLSTFKGKMLGEWGDYSFNMLRKWIPIPDGSLLYNHKDTGRKINYMPKLSFGYLQCTKARLGLILVKNVVPYILHRVYLGLEQSISKYPKPAPMSWISKSIWKHTDLQAIKLARRSNYKYLLSHLNNPKIKPFYPFLPEHVTPFQFPVLCGERDRLRDYLFDNKVFTDTHWNLDSFYGPKFRDTKKISPFILSVPIDQRYGKEDMSWLAGILNGFK